MKLLGIKEAAVALNVSPSTIRRKLKDDKFGGRAVRVGRRWKIPSDALLLTSEDKPEQEKRGPHWIVPPERGGGWKVVDEARIALFVEALIERLHPDFIVVGVRKGERIVSVLKLVPRKYREIVYHFDYFNLMPEDQVKHLLQNKTVLLLDDTIQRGRSLRLVREWFEQKVGNIKVYVSCLFARQEVRNRGDLEIPDVIAYKELDDSSYSLATAELSRLHRSLWPLDENHPIVWVTMADSTSTESIPHALRKLGRVLELPSPVEDRDVRMLVVDQIRTPMWSSLGLPKTARDWPDKKLRLIWDRESKQLLIAGIWFPALQASGYWLARHDPSPADPWYPYLYTQDTMTWKKLNSEQRALSMFSAWAIYCGIRLIATVITELVRYYANAFPNEANEWNVEDEDFIRSFGKPVAERIARSMRAEISKSLEISTPESMTEKQIPLQTVQVTRVMGNKVTIYDRVRPLVQFLNEKALQWEKSRNPNEAFPGLSYEEVADGVGDETSLMLDLALDYGFAKPYVRVAPYNGVIRVDRTYRKTEVGEEDNPAATDGMLIEKRIFCTVPLLCREFESSDPGQFLPSLTFHKLLVNVQANLAKGAINPSGNEGVNQTFVRETPQKFGPMAYTPYALTPESSISVVTYLSSKGIIAKPSDEDRPHPITLKPDICAIQGDDILKYFQDAWSEEDERVKADIRLLCILHNANFGKGIPTRGNLLTALAACSSERRFVYYSSALLSIWRACVGRVLNRIQQKIESGQLFADARQDMDTMLSVGGSLTSKVRWYKDLEKWQNCIEQFNPGNEHFMAKRRLLARIERQPNLSPQSRPRFIITVEPTVRLFGTLIRFVATQSGIISGSLAKQPNGTTPCSGFIPWDITHSLCNIAETCIDLRAQAPIEIEKVAQSLDRLSQLEQGDLDNRAVTDLEAVWVVVSEITSVGST